MESKLDFVQTVAETKEGKYSALNHTDVFIEVVGVIAAVVSRNRDEWSGKFAQGELLQRDSKFELVVKFNFVEGLL